MLKKLDKLIIQSFIGPFVVTFFVSLFVLVMQFFWLYMDELIGKGLAIWTIIQLLAYMSTTLVPLALPLSVLLASIMTFGDMGENFELVALKSSGISLVRFMRPLFIFMVGISGLAFVFNNNVIPVANLKALSLLYDVRNSKPTLNIRPGQFNNEIPNFSIRVGSKDEVGNKIHDILIYDQSDMVGNNKVIVAKEGEMIPTADKQSLIFRLQDGWRYEESYDHGVHDADMTQIRMHFARWDKVFDLSTFNFTRSNSEVFKNAYQMMDAKQLSDAIDSLRRSKPGNASIRSNIAAYVTLSSNQKNDTLMNKRLVSSKPNLKGYKNNFLEYLPEDKRLQTLQTATNDLRNFQSLMNTAALLDKLQRENLIKYGVELHRKFSLSFACILLFLIGAPLGAIIRKGGLGMPLVFAVSFFIAFHMLNISGEKLARSETLAPWAGMWMASGLLAPIAILLIVTARNDSRIFTKDWYLRMWSLIKSIFVKNRVGIAKELNHQA